MIKTLTSLRFFFAIIVFLSHIQFFDPIRYPVFSGFYDKFFFEGYLGVSFFFILSGFILSYNYDYKIINRKTSFKDFWVARIARIYPLHLVGLLVAVLLVVDSINSVADFFATPALSISVFLSNATLLHSFIPDGTYFFSYNGPAWSISDELFFYLMFPFIVYLFIENKILLRFAWILYLIIPVLMYYSSDSQNIHHRFFYINPFFRIVDFIIGINLNQLFKLEIFRRIYRNKLMATSIEIASIGIFVWFLSIHDNIPQVYRYSCFYWLPMVLIIFSFAQQNGYVSSLISGSILVLLGEMSFSFYLFHQSVIRYFMYKNDLMGITNNHYVLSSAILITSLIISYFAHKYIELPCNAYIKNKYRKSALSLPVKE